MCCMEVWSIIVRTCICNWQPDTVFRPSSSTTWCGRSAPRGNIWGTTPEHSTTTNHCSSPYYSCCFSSAPKHSRWKQSQGRGRRSIGAVVPCSRGSSWPDCVDLWSRCCCLSCEVGSVVRLRLCVWRWTWGTGCICTWCSWIWTFYSWSSSCARPPLWCICGWICGERCLNRCCWGGTSTIWWICCRWPIWSILNRSCFVLLKFWGGRWWRLSSAVSWSHLHIFEEPFLNLARRDGLFAKWKYVMYVAFTSFPLICGCGNITL